MQPTGPQAADTSTVSPGIGSPRCSSPAQAVSPGMPRIPIPVLTGAASGSSFRRSMAPVLSPYSCQPLEQTAISPGAKSGWRDSTTSATVRPGITSPGRTRSAYRCRPEITPRRYGSSER